VNLDLSEEQRGIRDVVRELCATEFAPHATEWDRDADVPSSALATLSGQGFLSMAVPEAWGGVGYDARTLAIVVEEIARVSAALAIMIAVHNSVGLLPILRYGTDEQKKRFLPRLSTKELAAFSLSEPDAGSDVGALSALARRDGDSYVLEGSKNWVTNGLRASIYVIFVRTGPGEGSRGISAFIVERGAPGLTIGKAEDKMGLRGSDTVSLSLEGLRVPATYRLGEEGQGM
jgi:alkylation response protein AidB-like acyl-CoA dehydrogenase